MRKIKKKENLNTIIIIQILLASTSASADIGINKYFFFQTPPLTTHTFPASDVSISPSIADQKKPIINAPQPYFYNPYNKNINEKPIYNNKMDRYREWIRVPKNSDGYGWNILHNNLGYFQTPADRHFYRAQIRKNSGF